MRQPEKYFCDMCGEEITSPAGVINRDIPVVTDQDWDVGGRVPFHVRSLKMDLCCDCYLNAFNIKCKFRGANPTWRHTTNHGEVIKDAKTNRRRCSDQEV